MTAALTFSCPGCATVLDNAGVDRQRCPADGATYQRRDGIWRMLLPAREAALSQFMREYETVRRREGRGDAHPAYYRALPFRDISGRFSNDWKIRAASFRALVDRILPPLEASLRRACIALDLGAGCGWLAYRLAQRGHTVGAVDLQTNGLDGLGAHAHYDAAFVPIQAEFDRLPLASGLADLVVFNASLHYSTDYVATLREALRVLRPGGTVVILDSPVYRHASSGQAMVREREVAFCHRFGFPSNAIASEHYLTHARLRDLADQLDVRWRMAVPRHGMRFAIRRWKTLLLGRREAARFPLIVARKET